MHPLISAAAMLVAVLLLASPASAAIVSVDLRGQTGTGFASYSGFNNEEVEPNSGLPGSKDSDYPYYFDAALGTSGLWVFVAAEPLVATNTYEEESSFTVLNKTVTDDDANVTFFGSVSFEENDVSPTGTTILAPGTFTLELWSDLLSPINSLRNINNEFAWSYRITPSNITGTGITFTNGVITSIDLTADIFVEVLLLGNPGLAMTPGFTETSGLVMSGDTFLYSVSDTTPQDGFFGMIDVNLFVLNRGGSLILDPIVPVGGRWLPVAILLGLWGTAAWLISRRFAPARSPLAR